MKSNGEKENINQHRQQRLERMDEIRHRQDRLGSETKRRNGKSASRIHGKTFVSHVKYSRSDRQVSWSFLPEQNRYLEAS